MISFLLRYYYYSKKNTQKTYEFHNLENYHGTGAFNLTKYPTWDCILTDMLRREKKIIIIAAKRRGAGHGGWSKHNPYLQEVRICI